MVTIQTAAWMLGAGDDIVWEGQMSEWIHQLFSLHSGLQQGQGEVASTEKIPFTPCILIYSKAKEKWHQQKRIHLLGKIHRNKMEQYRIPLAFVLEGEMVGHAKAAVRKAKADILDFQIKTKVSEAHKMQSPSQSPKPACQRNRCPRLLGFS